MAGERPTLESRIRQSIRQQLGELATANKVAWESISRITVMAGNGLTRIGG